MCYLLLYLMLLRILFFLILLMSSKPTASGNALVGTIISTHEIWSTTPSSMRLSSDLQRKERRKPTDLGLVTSLTK